MKKVMGVLVIMVFAIAINMNYSTQRPSSSNIDLTNLIGLNTANAESGGYSCTAYTACVLGGSVKCTGTKCERGHEYVKCDGKRTDC